MSGRHYDVIVVGAGAAGCTAAAYLSKEKYSVLLLEKDAKCGGLLGSFMWHGHVLDQGARGLIDSGIVFPMLRQLNLDVPMLDNPVKMIIEDRSMDFNGKPSVDAYGELLKQTYPENSGDIDRIVLDIKEVMKAMDVLYGIENPLFLPKPYEMRYVTKTLLPWMGRFAMNMAKPMKLMEPIQQFLRKRTSNEGLIYTITQHFFEDTPTFFALSYFTLYSEYHYPKGSTQSMVDAWVSSILKSGGVIENKQEVISIDPENKVVVTQDGSSYSYNELLWAADMTLFYKLLDYHQLKSPKVKEAVIQSQQKIANKLGSDSVFSLYVLANLDVSYFKNISGPHAFYTKEKEALSKVSLKQIQDASGKFVLDKKQLFDWLSEYIKYNTFEISIPAARDASLSPQGETGLIISILFDYELTKHLVECGYYDELKTFMATHIVELLSDSLYPKLKDHTMRHLVASPWTIVHRTNNHQGSLTGWSFKNQPFPVEHRFLHVAKSVRTPVPSIKQAGQWTFNPAGVPVAILTGKLAADATHNDLKKRKR